jgi:hypothetical protein
MPLSLRRNRTIAFDPAERPPQRTMHRILQRVVEKVGEYLAYMGRGRPGSRERPTST